MPSAIITGITGQDGSYLTELLLEQGYVVHGLVRRSSNTVRQRLDHLTSNSDIYNKVLFLHYSDIDDSTTLRRVLNSLQPDELYHLAGQSHVGLSFEIPESTCDFTAMGTLRLLEILRDMNPRPKLVHASSSEIFGRPDQFPQDESTPFNPVTPYGVAKAFATQMVRVYRESHKFFACNAICYNHESPRRGESFVTRKIARAVARIHLGLQDKLVLGNIDSQRDWGHAQDYVRAMWLMLQNDVPDDYVIATGHSHSVKDILELAFGRVGLKWQDNVQTDPKLFRPAEVQRLIGNSSHARNRLGWEPRFGLKDLIVTMVDEELELAVL